MKIYKGPSGMVPNIGEFSEGQQVEDSVAAQLEAAGYVVESIPQTVEEPAPPLHGGEA